jgi:hypothetical protein
MALSSTARISKLLSTKRRSRGPTELPSLITYSFSTFLLELMTQNLEVSSKNLESLSQYRSKEMRARDSRITDMSALKSPKMLKRLKK